MSSTKEEGRLYRAKRVAQGRCIQCNKKHTGSMATCLNCRRKNKKRIATKSLTPIGLWVNAEELEKIDKLKKKFKVTTRSGVIKNLIENS